MTKVDMLPMPNKMPIMADLDNTLIDDHTMDVTDRGVYPAIAAAQARGHMLILNSNTPGLPLLRWRSHFNMNGPIVAEGGAVVHLDPITPIYQERDARVFDEFRSEATERLRQNGIATWNGDPIAALRDGLSLPDMAPGPVALINEHRLCSFSLSARRVSPDGRLHLEPETTQHIADILHPLYADADTFIHDLSPGDGSLLVNHRSITKLHGSRVLADVLGVERFAMIGDSINDYIGSLATHYAVANASDAFKERADYVADQPYSAGAIEILKVLTERDTVAA